MRKSAWAPTPTRTCPFEKLVDEVQAERDLSRSPLAQVALASQNQVLSRADLSGVTLTPVALPALVAKFDLAFIVAEGEGCFEGAIQYATDLYGAPLAVRLAGQYAAFLGERRPGPESLCPSSRR